MKLGAHVSTSGGLTTAIDRALSMKAETIQIFGSSPRNWRSTAPPQDQLDTFARGALDHEIGPVFLHGSYLINLGSDNETNIQKSVDSLVKTMSLCREIGAQGVIFHLGSHKGYGYESVFNQTLKCCQKVLERTPNQVQFIIENAAGMGHHIGADFKEIGRIVKGLRDSRVNVCLDTQHCFAAGYDVTKRETLQEMLDDFDREIGLENLQAVHANDSKTPLGSGVDRHENIGFGQIGENGFATIMSHIAFERIPFLLEVPGTNGTGPDVDNLDRLKAIRDRLGLGRE